MSSSQPLDTAGQKRRRRRATVNAGAVNSVASAPVEIQIAYQQEEDDDGNDDGEDRIPHRPHDEEEGEDDEDGDGIHPAESHQPRVSFQDQLAASALSGTIEFLKVAGGLTLNATGKVVAPPLHVTRTVLLPALWAASMDYVSGHAPQRAKDWFRIISTSVHQFIEVLKETERGQIFRRRLLLLGGDLLDCLSADTTRQLLIDVMAGMVKLVEAFNTPEAKSFLDQFTIICCRITQVAASGRSQQAMHDTKKLVWSGVELLADPRSTTALAEVTAYLCHALEMEEAILDGEMRHRSGQERSDRRKEREEYQKETFQEKTTLMGNPNATVEQVILSSLGGPLAGSETLPDFEESIASHDVTSSNVHHNDGKLWSSDAGSIRKQVEEASFQTDDEWHEKAQKNVDVRFLRNQISKRSDGRIQRDYEDIPRDIPVVTTTTTPPSGGVPSHPHDPRDRSSTTNDGLPNSGALPRTEDDDDALHRFYRVLDSVIREKRVQGLDQFLAKYDESTDRVVQEGRVHKFDHGKGVGKDYKPHEVVTNTIRSRLATIRADVNKGLDREDREKLKRMEVVMRQNSKAAYLVMAVVVRVVLLWMALGGYGLYAILTPSIHRAQSSIRRNVMSRAIPEHGRSPVGENEIVIRMVREIVHVDQKGVVLDRSPDRTEVSNERIEKIASCVAALDGEERAEV